METRKEMILAALDAFVRQRSGIDWRNYWSPDCDMITAAQGQRNYSAEARGITRDLRDYRALRLVVGLRIDITADDLVAAFRDAYGGRLTLTELPADRVAGSRVPVALIEYCIGQYFPTEYRKAACAVLASALWAAKRSTMGDADVRDGMSAGDWLRASFRKEFGKGVASRWFS